MASANRVQGIHSGIEDLVLESGKGLELELGAAVLPVPTLKRTIYGASSIELEVRDEDGSVRRNTLLAEKWDVGLDGLSFRYVALSKRELNLELTLEDRWAAMLRAKEGPVKVQAHRGQPSETTRAEFVKRLVEEACPGLEFFCPQLHRRQPLDTKEKAKRAKQEAEENRRKGIGGVKHLTIDGAKATSAQLELGELALHIAESHNAPFIVQIALIAALMDETNMGEAVPGNVLGALGPGGAEVANAATEIKNFLTGSGGYGVGAIAYAKAHPKATFYEIDQALQGSGAGISTNGRANYGKFGREAREWVSAFHGESSESGSIAVTEPYYFEVKKTETYWDAIKRLAKEVNWRAFVVANKFLFMPEPELFRSMVRLAIGPETEGVENVDFEYDMNQGVTEVTVTALVRQWKPPPGSVVTLEGYGPASLGFGDALGGKKIGLSGNVNTRTGEGRGRYLVESIEVPLSGDAAQRMAKIKLKTPTRPLPEKLAKVRHISVGAVGAAGNKTVERMLAAADRVASLEKPYIWGGFDPKTGMDCSGGVSWALNVGGFMEGRTNTMGLAGFGEKGPGKWITVYVHANTGDPRSEHCAIEIAGNVYESGGGGENENPNTGWGKVEPGEVDSFLRQFETKRHPKGF